MRRNGMDLREAEDIKKRWQEYTEELYKKELHDQDNHDGVITHLEPDILECEVKWALEIDVKRREVKSKGEEEEPRWRRSRMRRTFSPPQIHQKNI